MAKQKYIEVLVDLEYRGNQNQFLEFYGDSVNYQHVEQESYIEFKTMVDDYIGKIKFRKAREISKDYSLTCRLTMTPSQYSLFQAIYKGEAVDEEESTEEEVVYKRFFFLHDFTLRNLRLYDEPNSE